MRFQALSVMAIYIISKIKKFTSFFGKFEFEWRRALIINMDCVYKRSVGRSVRRDYDLKVSCYILRVGFIFTYITSVSERL